MILKKSQLYFLLRFQEFNPASKVIINKTRKTILIFLGPIIKKYKNTRKNITDITKLVTAFD